MRSAAVRITILVDNQAGNGLIAEHGLSFWIETQDKSILFDTGQGCALKPNARELRVDLSTTDVLVLSHGHYDHTGGISEVLQLARKTEVYCHSGALQPRYRIRDGMPKPIHMPQESLTSIEELPQQRQHWVTQALWLCEGIGITGAIPRETSYEDPGGPFYLDPKGQRADPIEDDMALWISTDDGLVVCVGCCHAGLVNTLNYVCRLTKQGRIRAIIGGFHLLDADEKRLDLTLSALRSFSPGLVIPCHCTGEAAIKALTAALRERVVPGYSGTIFE